MRNSMHRRDYLKTSLAVAGATLVSPARAASANDKIGLGFIGLGGQGNGLLDRFSKHSDVAVRYLCDADSQRAEKAGAKFPGAKTTQDLRRVVQSDDVDAVVIATCNHWHCLAAVLAIEAGKDVYVEKPMSHNIAEGRRVVEAAQRLGRIVQVGTQQRSDPLQQDLKAFLHDRAELGRIVAVEGCRYGVRQPIGKRSAPLKPPTTVDYNLWLGPAQDEPIYRDKFHYDWHWAFNTGNGEFGNWGVHVIDDILNVVFQDSRPLPDSVQAGGGRLVWDDAGESPNLHFAYFKCGDVPVCFGLSNLPRTPDADKALSRRGVGSGYVVYCEGGHYAGGRGGGAAYDSDGKKIRTFRGNGGTLAHPRNFLDAVKTRDASSLNADVLKGDASANWCHLANIAARVGKPGAVERLETAGVDTRGLVEQLGEQLRAYRIDPTNPDLRYSNEITIDANADPLEGKLFGGSDGAAANALISRTYRNGFEMPTA